METIQSGNLLLYSSLLVANSTNIYGTANANFTEMTFKNIDLKQIIGSNYDKYLKFNLILTSIIVPTTVTSISGNDSNVMLYMAGVPFDSGSTYNTVSNTLSSIAYIGTLKISTGATGQVETYSPYVINTIIKPDARNNITIILRGAVASLTATGATFLLPSATIYPQMVFSFSVVPVIETLILAYPTPDDKYIGFQQRLFKK
jgi:aminopeptidase C